MALRSLLPWVNTLFAVPELDTPVFEKRGASPVIEEEGGSEEVEIWADWTLVVKSVRAFIGIAYAIVSPPTSLILPS